MPTIEETVFTDIPIKFNAHPITGNIPLLKNADAVKNAVKNLILTNHYERPYNSIFGGDVISQLFENFDPLTEHTLKKNIETAIRNYEPRAQLDTIKISIQEEHNGIDITIRFRIRNNAEPVSINVFLERVR